MRTKKKHFLPWLGRHKVSIIISVVAVIAAVAFNVWNVSAIEVTITRLNKETDTMIQATDKKLKEIQDKKALEAKIKQEEEAKQAAAVQKAKEEAAKQAGADTYSARPGYSEHQTGLAFDVAANGCTLNCFGSTSQYQWFQQNAADYGFIQRYYSGYEVITGYKSEEWYYRYVGASIAKDMQAKGIKTLEQYWNIPGGDYN